MATAGANDVQRSTEYSPVAAETARGGAAAGEEGADQQHDEEGRRLLLVASNVPDKATLMRAAQPSVTVVEYDFDEQLDLEKLALASTWLTGDSSPARTSCTCLTCRRGAVWSCTAPPAWCTFGRS